MRQRELRRPNGFADELRVALRDDTGHLGRLHRAAGARQPPLHRRRGELRCLPQPGAGRGGPARPAHEGRHASPDGEPGLLVLAPDLTAELRDSRADHWLGTLAADGDAELPAVVRAVANRARRHGDTGIARARAQTTDGRWLLIRGSRLGEGARCPDRHPHRAGPGRRPRADDRRRLRPHRPRTYGDRARGPRPPDERDRRGAPPLELHRCRTTSRRSSTRPARRAVASSSVACSWTTHAPRLAPGDSSSSRRRFLTST